ncbi:hypothetical protein [Clostridium scatologenes]|uniref:Uncharacterized protein n=1 Tax=Clostridium scatologenes TaxID=1548 RepID=A0A0E3GRK7_CLOSL|nr:hypothetical protein [Clostridium scatologenes]AKA70491.1 hypothetical protein CSCA_3366 [Clostridium scatologenes]
MRKMDEMEMSISLKSIKCAWIYTIVFLAVWTIYNFIHTGDIGLAGFLLITQNLIMIIVQLFLKWKFGKDEE